MNNITVKERVILDFESTREGCFTAFIFVGLFIMFLGLGGKHGHPPPNFTIILSGLAASILSGLARLSTDDHMIFDRETGFILLSNQFLFVKRTIFLCPLKDLLEIKLATSRRSNKSGSYTDFFIQVKLPGYGIRKDKDVVSIREMSGYQFDGNVAGLRNKALKIAEMAECKIIYSEKIDPVKRKQPEAFKNEAKKKAFIPYSVKPADNSVNKIRAGTQKIEFNNFLIKPEKKPLTLSEIESDFIGSDFTDNDSKTCPECGEKSPSQNRFCISCGRTL